MLLKVACTSALQHLCEIWWRMHVMGATAAVTATALPGNEQPLAASSGSKACCTVRVCTCLTYHTLVVVAVRQ